MKDIADGADLLNAPVNLDKPLPKKAGKDLAPSKKGRGRPPHEPTDVTRKQVEMCCGMGWNHDQIARFMCISDETLRRHYKHELSVGKGQILYKVAQSLYEMALDPNHRSAAACAMFIMKTQAGWRETNRVEHTGADGGAIQTEVTAKNVIDSRLLTADERQSLREIIEKTSRSQQPIEHAVRNEAEDAEYVDQDEED